MREKGRAGRSAFFVARTPVKNATFALSVHYNK